jgi:1,4-alpha-glucan branching enzyme
VREAIRIDEETKVLLEELKNKVFKKDTKKATRK